jgi:L-cysteine S-thiosulfotransferase
MSAAARLAGVIFSLLAGPASTEQLPTGPDQLGPQTRAMQEDDSLNPGMLWVLEGAALWREPAGSSGRSCADCHGDAAASMRGVATRYPAFDPVAQGPLSLEGRLQRCRRDHQGAAPLPPESDDRLGLLAFVAHQSRGLSIAVPEDERLQPALSRGRELFESRQGQLDLSCADCHDRYAGHRLGGSVIPLARPTGYPVYRLEWQALGSLQRRLRNCMIGIRAVPFPFDSPEHVELELYLTFRAQGLPLATPGVRP